MFKLHLNTSQDVDFSVLTKRLHKSEKRCIDMLTQEQQEQLVLQDILTESELDNYRRRLLAHNKTLDWKTNCTLSNTDAQLHALGTFYEKGIIQSQGYTVMRINLAPAIVDIIALMSRLTNYRKCDLSHLNKKISELTSGLITSDKVLQNTLTELVSQGNPLLSAYIDKALSRDNSTVIVEPLFSVKYVCRNITSLEGIVLPLALSLNMLSYAIVGQLFNNFRRGEKRFICVDKHSIYYHVRNDIVPYFSSGEYYVDGVKMDFTVEECKFPLKDLQGSLTRDLNM